MPGVGDVDVEVQEVRDAGAGDRDREGKRPVGEGSVAARVELREQPDDDHEHLDAAAEEVAEGLQVVRRGLTAGRRQDLHHPKDEDDLRHLRRHRSGKEPTNEWNETVVGDRPMLSARQRAAPLAHPPHDKERAPYFN